MNDLPDPPIPAECDLHDFPRMPLDIVRLKKSKSWLEAKRSPELGFYMVNIWTAAFADEDHPGALEDDDDRHCDLAMCDPRRWPKVREKVMRHWVRHSNGMLYHPVVTEIVTESWGKRLAYRARTEKARASRKNTTNSMVGSSVTGIATEEVTEIDTGVLTDVVKESVTTPVTETKVEGKKVEGSLSTLRSDKPSPPPPPPAPPARARDPVSEIDRQAAEAARHFEAERERCFPQESRFPAPALTLQAEARVYLVAGCPLELLIDGIGRCMATFRDDDLGAPKSFKAFDLTIRKFIKQHLEAGKPPANGGTFHVPENSVSDAQRRAERVEKVVRQLRGGGSP